MDKQAILEWFERQPKDVKLQILEEYDKYKQLYPDLTLEDFLAYLIMKACST